MFDYNVTNIHFNIPFLNNYSSSIKLLVHMAHPYKNGVQDTLNQFHLLIQKKIISKNRIKLFQNF